MAHVILFHVYPADATFALVALVPTILQVGRNRFTFIIFPWVFVPLAPSLFTITIAFKCFTCVGDVRPPVVTDLVPGGVDRRGWLTVEGPREPHGLSKRLPLVGIILILTISDARHGFYAGSFLRR
jgi:hypothetical protein